MIQGLHFSTWWFCGVALGRLRLSTLAAPAVRKGGMGQGGGTLQWSDA